MRKITNNEKKVVIYKYSSIAFKTYIIMSGVISILTSLILLKYLPYSFAALLKNTFGIMFKQLSFILTIIAAIIAMDTSLLLNLSKENEDYSIIKMLHENNNKMKIEIFSSIVGINLFIVGSLIEEWINDLNVVGAIEIPNFIIVSIFGIGLVFLVMKLNLARNRKNKHRDKLKASN